MISLLTPEYQKRMVQSNYHEAVSNSPQWMASFCYPEGLMRWWAQFSHGGPIEVMTTPHQVQFLTGIADNLLRRVLVGRKHVQKVPQWYGETVGFWNGNTLVSWTANVQGWTLSHSMFEFSNSLQVVEVFRPSADGKTITVEATFYDPEAFIRPLHTATPWDFVSGLDDPDARFSFVECRVQSTILMGPTDGRRSSRSSTMGTWTTSAARGRRTGKSTSSRGGNGPSSGQRHRALRLRVPFEAYLRRRRVVREKHRSHRGRVGRRRPAARGHGGPRSVASFVCDVQT